MKFEPTSKEELEEHFQFESTIIATKGALKSKCDVAVYTKKELLEELLKLLPEGEFGYSVLYFLKPEEKGC